MECKICGNTGNNKSYTFKELMYGTHHEFDYFECSECGCLQIGEIPGSLSQYYPSNYYSFNSVKNSGSVIKNYVKRKRFWYSIKQRGIVGKLLVEKYGTPPVAGWVKTAGLKINDRILDVGCGDGHIIRDLYHAGFENVCGIDAFIENDFLLEGKVKIQKRTIEQVEEKFDFIMFNHSFEHVTDPLSTFKAASKALKPGGTILIRIPVTGKFAWREFKENWVSLDVPRHLFLHSEKSVKLVGEKSGFVLTETVYDSDSFQFWGSIQYQQNIKLWDNKSYAVNPVDSIFSEEKIAGFNQKAAELNNQNDGDQACFYFKKA